MNNINDYSVLDNFGGLSPNQIAVASTFATIGETAPDMYNHNGKDYHRGATASIPMELAQDIACVRIYECEQSFVKPQTGGIIHLNEYPNKYII